MRDCSALHSAVQMTRMRTDTHLVVHIHVGHTRPFERALQSLAALGVAFECRYTALHPDERRHVRRLVARRRAAIHHLPARARLQRVRRHARCLALQHQCTALHKRVVVQPPRRGQRKHVRQVLVLVCDDGLAVVLWPRLRRLRKQSAHVLHCRRQRVDAHVTRLRSPMRWRSALRGQEVGERGRRMCTEQVACAGAEALSVRAKRALRAAVWSNALAEEEVVEHDEATGA